MPRNESTPSPPFRRPVTPGVAAGLALLALATTVTLAAPARAADGSPPIRFVDAVEAWGLVFDYEAGATAEFYMPETMGAGLALVDYDGDGDEDVLFVDSGFLRPEDGPPGRSVLYRNDGGTFVDVTDRAGVEVAGYGMGAVAADMDDDGDQDVLVTAYGPQTVLENRGDGTFRPRPAALGLGEVLWATAGAFGDADGDGDLDLYVAGYIRFSIADNRECTLEGERSYCHPREYEGLADAFFVNRGDGTFEDATEAAGLAGAEGRGLGVVWHDFDLDGDQDLYVANDMDANFFFVNRGGGRFEEMALLAGTAVSDRGRAEASMGVAVGDVTGDLLPDLFLTHFELEHNALYVNQGQGLFVDARHRARLSEPSLFDVAFGTVFADFDHDGWLDIAVANGHVNLLSYAAEGRGQWRQPNRIFRNQGQGRFEEVEGAGLDTVAVSRGLAAGDLDGDGDLDLVISNNREPAEAWENVSPRRGGWLLLDLEQPAPNRDAVGARVILERGGERQVRTVEAGSSYLSDHARSLHFGLGEGMDEGMDEGEGEPEGGGDPPPPSLEITWPDGAVTVLRAVPEDRRLVVRRPRPAP